MEKSGFPFLQEPLENIIIMAAWAEAVAKKLQTHIRVGCCTACFLDSVLGAEIRTDFDLLESVSKTFHAAE